MSTFVFSSFSSSSQIKQITLDQSCSFRSSCRYHHAFKLRIGIHYKVIKKLARSSHNLLLNRRKFFNRMKYKGKYQSECCIIKNNYCFQKLLFQLSVNWFHMCIPGRSLCKINFVLCIAVKKSLKALDGKYHLILQIIKLKHKEFIALQKQIMNFC